MRFIQRDYDRTVHDDFLLNVQNYMTDCDGAVSVYINETLVGWKIQPLYE